MQRHVPSTPIPVGHALDRPSKVAQLTPLEQRGASRLVRTAQKVRRTVHFDRKPPPILQSSQRIDAVPGGLAAMLFLDLDTARTDFSYDIGLQLRRLPFVFDESVAAGLT